MSQWLTLKLIYCSPENGNSKTGLCSKSSSTSFLICGCTKHQGKGCFLPTVGGCWDRLPQKIMKNYNCSKIRTVSPVKPWTPEKISGMFIVLWPIRCKMKPQKIADKWQQGSVMTWYETTSWLFLLCQIFNFPFGSLWFFDHKPTPVTWFGLFKNQTTQ